MPRAVVNSIDTYYDVTGEGEPLLFIHGGYGGAWSTIVPPTIPDLLNFLPPERVMSITYDRRCSGRSQYTADHFTQADLAADARALLDHLGVREAIIYGASAGGPIALQFALDYPDRVRSLCLTCTAAYLMHDRPRTRQIRAFVEQAKTEGDASLFDTRRDSQRNPPIHPSIRFGGTVEDEEERASALREALTRVSDEDLFLYSTGEIRNMEAALAVNYETRLGEIKVPTIVVHGTADGTVPIEWGEALHRGIAGSEFRAIPDANHVVSSWPEGARVIRTWIEAQLTLEEAAASAQPNQLASDRRSH